MDAQAGEILSRLERDGLADNTVVFFWSDHGRGLPRCKRWLYDSGIHVPLVVRWSGHIGPGSVCEDFVSLMDLGATVMSVTGVAIPAYMQGRARRRSPGSRLPRPTKRADRLRARVAGTSGPRHAPDRWEKTLELPPPRRVQEAPRRTGPLRGEVAPDN